MASRKAPPAIQCSRRPLPCVAGVCEDKQPHLRYRWSAKKCVLVKSLHAQHSGHAGEQTATHGWRFNETPDQRHREQNKHGRQAIARMESPYRMTVKFKPANASESSGNPWSIVRLATQSQNSQTNICCSESRSRPNSHQRGKQNGAMIMRQRFPDVKTL